MWGHNQELQPSWGAGAHIPSSPSGHRKHHFSSCYRAIHMGWKIQFAHFNRKCCRAAVQFRTAILANTFCEEKTIAMHRSSFHCKPLAFFGLAQFNCGLFTTSHYISTKETTFALTCSLCFGLKFQYNKQLLWILFSLENYSNKFLFFFIPERANHVWPYSIVFI